MVYSVLGRGGGTQICQTKQKKLGAKTNPEGGNPPHTVLVPHELVQQELRDLRRLATPCMRGQMAKGKAAAVDGNEWDVHSSMVLAN